MTLPWIEGIILEGDERTHPSQDPQAPATVKRHFPNNPPVIEISSSSTNSLSPSMSGVARCKRARMEETSKTPLIEVSSSSSDPNSLSMPSSSSLVSAHRPCKPRSSPKSSASARHRQQHKLSGTRKQSGQGGLISILSRGGLDGDVVKCSSRVEAEQGMARATTSGQLAFGEPIRHCTLVEEIWSDFHATTVQDFIESTHRGETKKQAKKIEAKRFKRHELHASAQVKLDSIGSVRNAIFEIYGKLLDL